MGDILLVSKPIAPPWHDSSKNLVRDLALAMERHRPIVMTPKDGGIVPPHGRAAKVYGARSGGFSAQAKDGVRVLSALARERSDAWHFFFAPNPRTSLVGRFATRVRGKRSVQTVCSAPRPGLDVRALLFADLTVVLSRHSEERMKSSGASAGTIRRIAPSIPPLDVMDAARRQEARQRLGLPRDEALLVYPGDLEFSAGARVSFDAFRGLPDANAHLVFACRAKTPRAQEAERVLRDTVERAGLSERVHWLGETPDIHALLGAADVVLLPSETLYAKMDFPLVVLEAMCLERPVIVANGTPAAELAALGGAIAVNADADAVGAAVSDLLADDGRRVRLGSAARAAVLSHFGPKEMAARYERLYDELLG